MNDTEKVVHDLPDLCEYLFHEYKVCYYGDEIDTYNRFLCASNALNLLKEQQETIASLQRTICKLNDALTVHAQAEHPEEVSADE